MAKKYNIDRPKVTVRKRKLRTDTYSLYLDIIYNGTRTRENLELYIIPEVTRKDKLANMKAYSAASKMRDEREQKLLNGENSKEVMFDTDTPFLEYFRSIMERIKEEYSASEYKNWINCLNYLKGYCKEETTFNDITTEWCEGFKSYLDNAEMYSHRQTADNVRRLSNRTKHTYLDKLRKGLKFAFEDNLILTNPMKDVKNYSNVGKTPICLTWEEVMSLDSTICLKPTLKNMFLFSCFTGIRKKDMEIMRWGDIDESGEVITVTVADKTPTGYKVIVPEQAMKYLGKRGYDDDLVFPDYRYNTFIYVELRQWALDAGVMKDITFQSARTTFAVLLLKFGADVYTVAEMLGYSSMTKMDIFQQLASTNN